MGAVSRQTLLGKLAKVEGVASMWPILRRLLRSSSALSSRRAQLALEPLESRRLPSGNPLSSAFDVSASTSANQRAGGEHTVARSANGNFVVVWEGTDVNGDGVYARLFKADGSPLAQATRITGTDVRSSEATVAMNDTGNFVVAWTQQTSTGTDIRAQRFTATAQALGNAHAVATAVNNERSPSVGIDAAGNFAVAYTYSYSSTDFDIHLHRYRADGTNLGIRSIANTTSKEFDPSLAMNASGQMVVSYTRQNSAVNMQVYAQRVDSAGNLIGSAVAVVKSGAYDHDSSTAIDRNGNFIVAYSEAKLTSGVINTSDVYAQRVRANGTLDGSQIIVANSSSREEAGSVALVDNGGFAVGYTHAGDIRVQYFTTSNLRDGLVSVTASSVNEVDATVAFDRRGQLVVGYTSTNGKNNGPGVYARLYGMTPTLDVSDASTDDSAGTVFRDGALRFSYDFEGSALPVSQVLIQAVNNQGTAIALDTASGASLSDGLLNLAKVSGLTEGTYQVRARATLANGQMVDAPTQSIRLLGNKAVRGTFQAETFTFNVAGGTGVSFLGGGGTDTLSIDALRTDVAGINGLSLSSFTGQVNAQAIYRGSSWDFLRLRDGREAYFQGIERLRFSDGSVLELVQRPNDPAFASQWSLHVTDVAGTWRFTTGSSNVLLVSLDTGVNVRSGDDLMTARLILDPTDDDNDGDHGHNSLSILAAATNNGSGIAGINRVSQVMVADVYRGVSLQTAITEAVTYARDRGMKVVFQGGIQAEYWLTSGGTQAQLEALLRANEDIAVFAVAAGNGNIDIDISDPNNASVLAGLSGGVARLQTTHSNLIAVGAVERTSTTVNGLANAGAVNKATYSNFGSSLTLVAPTDSPATNGLGRIDPKFSGTSAANANLAGIASLVYSANTTLTGSQVRQIMTETALDIGAVGRDNSFGNGLVNADAAVRRAVALKRAADVANL